MPRPADGEAKREGEPGQKNGGQLRHAARKRLKKRRAIVKKIMKKLLVF